MIAKFKQIFDIFRREGSGRTALMSQYATIFIILFGIYYIPIDTRAGFGVMKFALMTSAVIIFFLFAFRVSKALVIGIVYLLYQYVSASFHPESFRWSTLLFSFGLVFAYICMYTLIYVERVFTIRHFIRITKWMMMAYFVFCVVQQCSIMVGMRIFPLINLVQLFDRGIGCNSLSMEPSTFARFMLVLYYAYVKCNEYLRGEGPFKVKELFSGEHKWVTIRFLWMMTTMGSGTAYVCLILFCLYFVRKHNFFYMMPVLIAGYIGLQALEIEQASRATRILNAMTTLDQEQVEMADGSGASRISPLLNSFKADFSKQETWFGHGIDYAVRHKMIVQQTATLFDDYGLILYLLGLLMNFACGYRFLSLGAVFMFAGVAGGAGTNIHYTWELMIIMTCVRYFYDNRYQLEEEDDEDETVEESS